MLLSMQYSYHLTNYQMFLWSNASYHLLILHIFDHLRICLNKFPLIQHLNSSTYWNFFEEVDLFQLFNIRVSKSLFIQVKTFLLHLYRILLNNSCFPFAIKAKCLRALARNLSHQNSNHDFLLLDILEGY